MGMNKVACHDIFGNSQDVEVNKLQFRPSVYGLLVEDGKVLLSKQYDGYDFAGGGVELGETMQEALIREFFEETGFEIEVGEPIHCESSFFHPAHSKKHKNEFWNCPLLYFTVKRIGGKLSVENFDEEEKEYAEMAEWVELSKIDELRFINSVDSPNIIKKALSFLL